MTNYIWSATDKSGKKVVKEIAAATAEDAKFVLVAQGYSNLELKQDEIGSAVQAGFPKRTNALGMEIKISAEERLKHRDDPTATYWGAIRKGLRHGYLGFWAFVFFLIYSSVRREWGYFLIYLSLFLIWLIFILQGSLQSVYYRKLIKASDWSRWRRVLFLVAALKIIGRFRKVKIPASELTRNRAKALVGLGRLDEALAEYQTYQGQPDCPDWLYLLFVGGLYAIAKQPDKAIKYNLDSLAKKPTSAGYLGLADCYVKYKRDPIKARAALVEAEKSPLSDIAKPYQLRSRGMIAYLEGDQAAAKRDLQSALELVQSAKGRPFRDGFLAITRAYLCCVLAKQGDLADAKKYFARARKYLIATKENELLAQCRQLTGQI